MALLPRCRSKVLTSSVYSFAVIAPVAKRVFAWFTTAVYRSWSKMEEGEEQAAGSFLEMPADLLLFVHQLFVRESNEGNFGALGMEVLMEVLVLVLVLVLLLLLPTLAALGFTDLRPENIPANLPATLNLFIFPSKISPVATLASYCICMCTFAQLSSTRMNTLRVLSAWTISSAASAWSPTRTSWRFFPLLRNFISAFDGSLRTREVNASVSTVRAPERLSFVCC